MKKKIYIAIWILLFVFFKVSMKQKVEASSNSFIDTGVHTTLPDSIDGNGCFLSLYDFCPNGSDDLVSFLRIEFPEETSTILRIQKAIEKGYFDDTFKPCMIYITNEESFNQWLRNKMYIHKYSTYRDGLGGFYGEKGTFINLGAYNALHELLHSEEELKAYILQPEEVPEVYYDIYETVLSTFGKYYKFSETRLPYIINSTWQYKALEYDGPVEKCKVLDLPNSIGKIRKITSTTYEYIYSKVLFDDNLGYYTLNQDETEVRNLTKEELPSFAFDSLGNVKDVYISKQDDLWTLPEVKQVSKVVNYYYLIRREFYYTSFRGSSDSGDDFYLFVAYMNFEVPIDTIEKIELVYRYWDVTQRYNPLKALGWVDYKINEAKCTIYRDTKVVDPFYKKNKDESYSYTMAITKSDYYFNKYYFEFRICLSDDNFVPKSYAEKDYYTSYELRYEPVNELQVVNLTYTYQSILYNSKNLYGIPIEGNNNPNDKEKWYEKLRKLILKLWNSGVLGKVVLIVMSLFLLFPIVYLLFVLIKVLKKLIANKKNKSTK